MPRIVPTTQIVKIAGLTPIWFYVNTTLTKYQNGLVIDQKLEARTNSATRYFLEDHLRSVVGVADTGGSVTDSNSFDAYGNASNGSFFSRYRFTGREKDLFTGLQFSRARYYDSGIGRFVSEDPIGFTGGDRNLYGYVRNSPLRRSDPSGLQETDVIILNSPPFRSHYPLGAYDTGIATYTGQAFVTHVTYFSSEI